MGVLREGVHELRGVAGHLLLGGECWRVWRSISPSVVACRTPVMSFSLLLRKTAAALLALSLSPTRTHTREQATVSTRERGADRQHAQQLPLCPRALLTPRGILEERSPLKSPLRGGGGSSPGALQGECAHGNCRQPQIAHSLSYLPLQLQVATTHRGAGGRAASGSAALVGAFFYQRITPACFVSAVNQWSLSCAIDLSSAGL